MRSSCSVIRSKDNPQIKQYCKLATARKEREETGLFALESHKLIADAIDAHIPLEKVFVTEQCLALQGAIVSKLLARSAQVLVIDAALESKMTQTHNAGGLFAIGKKLDKLTFSDTIKTHGRSLYLHGLQDTGNIGTIIRTAEALGFARVLLSKGTSDPYSLKVLRASMGAVFRLPIVTLADPLVDLKTIWQQCDLYATVLSAQATDVRAVTFAKHSVLLIGNEGNGLPPEVIACCQHQITIPMSGGANSLNASMAAGIFMWEQAKQATSSSS